MHVCVRNSARKGERTRARGERGESKRGERQREIRISLCLEVEGERAVSDRERKQEYRPADV